MRRRYFDNDFTLYDDIEQLAHVAIIKHRLVLLELEQVQIPVQVVDSFLLELLLLRLEKLVVGKDGAQQFHVVFSAILGVLHEDAIDCWRLIC